MQVGDPAAPARSRRSRTSTTRRAASRGSPRATQVTRYEHDAAGRVTAVVAADGGRLESVYDAADRLIERRYPGGRTYRYGRDADGELTSRALPSARIARVRPTGLTGQISSLDAAGRRRAPTRSPATTTSCATSVTTPSGAVRTVSVDARGRPTGVDGRTQRTYVPGVDRIGHYESTVAPGAAVQSLDPSFDGMRVTKLTADGLAPAETTWTYGADLRQTSTRLVSGTTTRRSTTRATPTAS